MSTAVSLKEFTQRGREIAAYRPPKGEGFQDCQERVVTALEDVLASSKGNLIILGYAGVNRVLLCHILGMPLENSSASTRTMDALTISGLKREVFY